MLLVPLRKAGKPALLCCCLCFRFEAGSHICSRLTSDLFLSAFHLSAWIPGVLLFTPCQNSEWPSRSLTQPQHRARACLQTKTQRNKYPAVSMQMVVFVPKFPSCCYINTFDKSSLRLGGWSSSQFKVHRMVEREVKAAAGLSASHTSGSREIKPLPRCPFSTYAVQDPSQGMVLPMVDRSSHFWAIRMSQQTLEPSVPAPW